MLNTKIHFIIVYHNFNVFVFVDCRLQGWLGTEVDTISPNSLLVGLVISIKLNFLHRFWTGRSSNKLCFNNSSLSQIFAVNNE